MNLAIDCVAEGNFYTCISCYRADGVTITGCSFYNSGLLNDPIWTLHAVLAAPAKNLRIEDNRVNGMQIKAAGQEGGGPGVFILRNYISNSHNLAISYVLINDTDVLGSAIISENIIESPGGQGGIYIGSDIDTALRGTAEDIIVADNIITGTWGAQNCTGITARLCRVTRSWLIRGNILRCDAAFPVNSDGILVQAFPGATSDRIAIVENHVENVDQSGIGVVGVLKSTLISGNTVIGARGIAIATLGGSGRVTVADNHVTGRISGISLHALNGDLICDVHDNSLWDFAPDGSGNSWAVRVIAEAGQKLTADVHDNRCRGAGFGIAEEGSGTFETEYDHNKLRGNATPLSVGPTAILHENRV